MNGDLGLQAEIARLERERQKLRVAYQEFVIAHDTWAKASLEGEDVEYPEVFDAKAVRFEAAKDALRVLLGEPTNG